MCSTAAVGGCEARGRKATLSLSLSLSLFFFIPSGSGTGRKGCVWVLLSSRERQSETRDMMETTTAATTTGREAEEGTPSRETLENHPGNAKPSHGGPSGRAAASGGEGGRGLREGVRAWRSGRHRGGCVEPRRGAHPRREVFGPREGPRQQGSGRRGRKGAQADLHRRGAVREEAKERDQEKVGARDRRKVDLSLFVVGADLSSFFLSFFLSSGRWTKTGSTSCERCSPTP